jgi:hypothetical protein
MGEVREALEERVRAWQCEFVVPSFTVPETSEVQPQIPWFDAGPARLATRRDIPEARRLRRIEKLTKLYKKITPTNTLIAHQLAKEDEDRIFKQSSAAAFYDDTYLLHFKGLLAHVEIIDSLAAPRQG